MTPTEYLNLPYHRVFIPNNGGFTGYIREFPGCIAEGESLQETYDCLNLVAEVWIACTIVLKQEIPLPLNGQPIYTRTAVNIGEVAVPDCCKYRLDDGLSLIHKQNDGAIKLAITMLKTIKEVK